MNLFHIIFPEKPYAFLPLLIDLMRLHLGEIHPPPVSGYTMLSLYCCSLFPPAPAADGERARGTCIVRLWRHEKAAS